MVLVECLFGPFYGDSANQALFWPSLMKDLHSRIIDHSKLGQGHKKTPVKTDAFIFFMMINELNRLDQEAVLASCSCRLKKSGVGIGLNEDRSQVDTHTVLGSIIIEHLQGFNSRAAPDLVFDQHGTTAEIISIGSEFHQQVSPKSLKGNVL